MGSCKTPRPEGSLARPCKTVPFFPSPQVFDEHMPTPNQISRQRDDVNVTAADILAVPEVRACWHAAVK